jgi:hypothetical protein
MTDPSGRSSPGEINNLLIWEQVHPFMFASYDLRAALSSASSTSNTTLDVLREWSDVLQATADFMAAFATRNTSTQKFDLGPPMYPVAEDTNPNVTRNAAFEVAYWKWGLGVAIEWFDALKNQNAIEDGEDVTRQWKEVLDELASLPVENGYYAIYEGAPEDFWDMPEFTRFVGLALFLIPQIMLLTRK